MKALLDALVTRFEKLESSLNTLDAATGDGDHGATMLKGLRAAAADPDAPEKAFRRAAGGASGSLFAVVLGALEKAHVGADLGAALGEAAAKVTLLGQARAGDKTMLDALIPAGTATSPQEAATLAAMGRDTTVDMAAKRGRARHVEGAGAGHVDAGATSVAEMLAEFAKAQEGRV